MQIKYTGGRSELTIGRKDLSKPVTFKSKATKMVTQEDGNVLLRLFPDVFIEVVKLKKKTNRG